MYICKYKNYSIALHMICIIRLDKTTHSVQELSKENYSEKLGTNIFQCASKLRFQIYKLKIEIFQQNVYVKVSCKL